MGGCDCSGDAGVSAALLAAPLSSALRWMADAGGVDGFAGVDGVAGIAGLRSTRALGVGTGTSADAARASLSAGLRCTGARVSSVLFAARVCDLILAEGREQITFPATKNGEDVTAVLDATAVRILKDYLKWRGGLHDREAPLFPLLTHCLALTLHERDRMLLPQVGDQLLLFHQIGESRISREAFRVAMLIGI